MLRELARLQGRAWQPQPFEEVIGRDASAQQRWRIEGAIAAARTELQDNAWAFRALGDLNPEALAAFRADAQAISGRITELKAELESLPESKVDVLTAQQVHGELLKHGHSAGTGPSA